MSVYKRKKTWWTDFSVNGQRFRESLDTSDWREAQAKEKELIAQASQGKLTSANHQFSRLAFGVAADSYLAEKELHVSLRTAQTEKERLKPLKAYFGASPLNRISVDDVRRYVVERKGKGLSNRTINMEVACLARILKRAKRWHLIADEVRTLPERRDIGRALTPEHKAMLLTTASSRPEWQIAYLAMRLALNTTMRACEIRGLRWRDVNLEEASITIVKSKTESGKRVIPLNDGAWTAMLELYERAERLLGKNLLPDWYVFPHSEGASKPDATKPMSNWRTAWRRLTRVIHCPSCGQVQDPSKVCFNDKCKVDLSKVKSPIAGLRFHDLRHHAITELAESSTSDQTIMSIAGHVSHKMLAHYSHVRLEAKRAALKNLSYEPTEVSHVTNNVTKKRRKGQAQSQVVENMVDVTGFEPATPCLQSRCSPS
jgi:integrase